MDGDHVHPQYTTTSSQTFRSDSTAANARILFMPPCDVGFWSRFRRAYIRCPSVSLCASSRRESFTDLCDRLLARSQEGRRERERRKEQQE